MDSFVPLHPTPAAWLQKSDLVQFMPNYWQYLVRRGYARSTRRTYVRCVAHFAHWLTTQRRVACDICDDDIGQFLDHHLPHCSCPAPVRRCRTDVHAALRHLLAVLVDINVTLTRPVANAVEEELRSYDKHMHHDRGLASNTRRQRLYLLRAFLLQKAGPDPTELTPVSACDLRQFIEETLQRWSPASANVLVGTLRSYLRFRALCGDQVDHLLPVVTSPANWRLSALPEILSPTEVAQILERRDGRSAHRAYAMIRCLVDLGLRASEVVLLDLDDVDWSAGTIRIGPSKSRRVDVLPLPRPTGSAISTYLCSERPSTNNRRIFVRHRAPVDEPIGAGVVRQAVRDAYRDCGLSHTRVHVLRHTLASRLIREGSTLKEVADVLRHHDLDTTLIYTKIDTVRLATVALPWPGGAS